MSDEPVNQRDDERTRPCPTCRMPVSILATKCRYCGAELGRPREETRSLSAKDLGGETAKQYAPSTNVMDALEAFRKEQTAQQRRSGSGSDLPPLDDKSQALASAVRAAPTRRPSRRAVARFSWADYGRYVLGGLTALVLAVAAITIIPQLTTGKVEEAPFVNRAPALLAQGAPAIEVLRAAREGVLEDPGQESETLMIEARDRVRMEVLALLNAANWTRQSLQQASVLATDAADVDPYRDTQAIRRMVDEEITAYSIVLAGTDPGSGELSFRPVRGEVQTFRDRDSLLLDRFRVVRVTDTSVRLLDQMRNGRELLWPIGGQPAPR